MVKFFQNFVNDKCVSLDELNSDIKKQNDLQI